MECHECGEAISDRAADCPYCGTSVRSASEGRSGGQAPPDPERQRGPTDTPGTEPNSPSTGGRAGGQSDPSTGSPAGGNRQSDRSRQGPPGRREGQAQRPAGPPGQGRPSGHGEPGGRGGPGQPTGGGQPGQPPGGPPGSGGAAGEHGSANDVTGRLGQLPLELSALAGAGAALVVGVLGFVLAVAYPDTLTESSLSTLDLAVLTLFDVQFVTPVVTGGAPGHIAPAVFGHFDQYAPPEATLGVLYVLPALVCYRAGSFVAGFQNDRDPSPLDSGLAGASVVVGYLPLMAVAAVVAPSDPVSVDTGTAVGLAGFGYPLLFGGLGGLVAGYYSSGEQRVGQAYSVAVLLGSLLLVFLTTFVTIETVPSGADETVGRLVATLFATVGALSLELDVSGTALLPYAVTVGLFLAFGALRVRRSPGVDSPLEGAAKGATLAPAYAVFATALFSLSAALGNTYMFTEYPDAYAVVGAAVDSDAIGGLFSTAGFGTTVYALGEVGPLVEAVALSSLVYGVAVAGGGGAFASWYANRGTSGTGPQNQRPAEGGGPPQRPRQ